MRQPDSRSFLERGTLNLSSLTAGQRFTALVAGAVVLLVLSGVPDGIVANTGGIGEIPDLAVDARAPESSPVGAVAAPPEITQPVPESVSTDPSSSPSDSTVTTESSEPPPTPPTTTTTQPPSPLPIPLPVAPPAL